MRWAAVLCLLAGCAAPERRTSPYMSSARTDTSTVEAERLTKLAADLVLSEPDRAEAILREALALDLFFGPAHNNLGVVHLKRGELYEAATEFEWARKLMPGHPDPRLNLAMTLEQADRTEEALTSYGAALEVYPGYLPAIQGLARIAVRESSEEPQLEGWLRRIVIEGEGNDWRVWASRQLSARWP